uniref:Uncharacterized protein n=1 Tax=Barley stripe mosaic virus TaxID=12327 RepID=Q83139_BSMV|nr:short ORF [Barley stripe mosaic virus]
MSYMPIIVIDSF